MLATPTGRPGQAAADKIELDSCRRHNLHPPYSHPWRPVWINSWIYKQVVGNSYRPGFSFKEIGDHNNNLRVMRLRLNWNAAMAVLRIRKRMVTGPHRRHLNPKCDDAFQWVTQTNSSRLKWTWSRFMRFTEWVGEKSRPPTLVAARSFLHSLGITNVPLLLEHIQLDVVKL